MLWNMGPRLVLMVLLVKVAGMYKPFHILLSYCFALRLPSFLSEIPRSNPPLEPNEVP